MSEKIKTNALLLKKQPYSESSTLMQVFSESLGMASILAKGLRRGRSNQDFLLNILNEYEFVLSLAPQGGIHTMVEVSLISEYPADLPLETWVTAQAGVELVSKLLIPLEEVSVYYHSLKQFLAYQKTISQNPVAILWRFMLHLNKLMGVPIGLHECHYCHNNMDQPAGYVEDSGQLICLRCFPICHAPREFNQEASRVISLLPSIGNYINDIILQPHIIREINAFFLHYLKCQFNHKIELKSLQYYNNR